MIDYLVCYYSVYLLHLYSIDVVLKAVTVLPQCLILLLCSRQVQASFLVFLVEMFLGELCTLAYTTSQSIVHFTVVCLVTWPMNESDLKLTLF